MGVIRLTLGLSLVLILSLILASTQMASPALQSQAGQFREAPGQLVSDMVKNEREAAKRRQPFAYISQETSSRTGGHQWTERVVETKEGLLRRLIAIDGRPLSPTQAAAEQRRLADLATHPEELVRLSQNRRGDEARATGLLSMIPRAFLFADRGIRDGCRQIAFTPNPKFHPSDFEERVLYALAGTVSIDRHTNRLCGIDAHLEHEVDFGFGLLGKVNQDGSFSLTREEVSPGSWKTIRLDVHLGGKILLMKSISRDQESIHSHFVALPPDLALPAAVALSEP